MNRLGESASAYLRSAAHQPIHWFPWGDDAFAAARAADKPVLLDVGAVWCHWCHVMDGESYEDPALAALLNQHFICIKVDRDERPDVDARYQRAVQVLTRQGGWPLTAFLTPDGEVFYGGTYFPPEGTGRPSFRTVLMAVLDAFRSRRDQIRAQAATIRGIVQESLDEAAPGELSVQALDTAVDAIAAQFDPVHGGFGTQPKFPYPTALTFLMHRWHDQPTRQLRMMIEHTLDAMAGGGIHDQIGGGFHRYSVDAEWIVPHFEKMSYDNSELLKAYTLAYSLFGAERYAEVARGIVRWVREVLADPEGGYAASQDADVGLHDDGDYFTWTRDEAAAVLTADELDVAAAYYDIGTAGEMHHNPGKNVLYVAATTTSIARRIGRTEEETIQLLGSAQKKLHAARQQRQAPFVDRTRYTNWNAMMASALLRAGAALEDDWATEHGLRTLERVRDESLDPDTVAHTAGGAAGLLDDQVQTAAAALDAYEATGDASWLEWADRIMERVWADYRDHEQGGLFEEARGRGGEGLLPLRAKTIQDTPTPSSNGSAATAYARLHHLTNDAKWHTRSAALIDAFAGRAADLGLHASAYLVAVDWHRNPTTHLVIVGEPGDGLADWMHRQALACAVPRRVVHRISAAAADVRRLPAALHGMMTRGRQARGYACTGTVCSAPAATQEEWLAALARLEQRDASPPFGGNTV
jgi:uncharacterized protein YyaL (SSP411 family)